MDAAVIYPASSRGGRRQPESALYAEKDSSLYAIRWVTRPDNAQDPRLLKFIAIYQGSEEVRATLRRLYHDLIAFPGWNRRAGDMGKQIRLNAFDMNTVGHIAHGYWRIRATSRATTAT